MDKSWMSAPRSTVEYDEGVSNFIEFAIEKAGMAHRLLSLATNVSTGIGWFIVRLGST
jgi:hypothetical protein